MLAVISFAVSVVFAVFIMFAAFVVFVVPIVVSTRTPPAVGLAIVFTM